MKKEKEILFDDIPVHIRERVYFDLGEASICWESPGGCGVFDSQKVAQIGLKLCQFILDQIERERKR